MASSTGVDGRGGVGVQRPVGVHERGEPIDVDQRVAVRARHPLVDLGDDEARRVRRGQRGVDRRAQRAVAVAVGRRQLEQRDVERRCAFDVNSRGMSERKIGTKSARPSATASRSGAPVNSDTERNRPACAGSANGAGPAVCR